MYNTNIELHIEKLTTFDPNDNLDDVVKKLEEANVLVTLHFKP
jgi:hypothetical protein